MQRHGRSARGSGSLPADGLPLPTRLQRALRLLRRGRGSEPRGPGCWHRAAPLTPRAGRAQLCRFLRLHKRPRGEPCPGLRGPVPGSPDTAGPQLPYELSIWESGGWRWASRDVWGKLGRTARSPGGQTDRHWPRCEPKSPAPCVPLHPPQAPRPRSHRWAVPCHAEAPEPLWSPGPSPVTQDDTSPPPSCHEDTREE